MLSFAGGLRTWRGIEGEPFRAADEQAPQQMRRPAPLRNVVCASNSTVRKVGGGGGGRKKRKKRSGISRVTCIVRRIFPGGLHGLERRGGEACTCSSGDGLHELSRYMYIYIKRSLSSFQRLVARPFSFVVHVGGEHGVYLKIHVMSRGRGRRKGQGQF